MDRERIIEAMARAVHERWADDNGALSWDSLFGAGRDRWIGYAEAALDAALAVRTECPCPNCKGHQPPDGTTPHLRVCTWCVLPCFACSGSGVVPGVPALVPRDALEQVGWITPTHTRKFGYVLNVEPIESAGEDPVYRLSPPSPEQENER